MSVELDLLIFDLDGTLIDSKLDIANAVNYMLNQLGLSPLENETIYSYVGHGVANLIKRSITDDHLDKFDSANTLFRERYFAHLLDCTTLYPNVENILSHFSAKKKAVVTNKDGSWSDFILKNLGIYDNFAKVVAGDDMEKRKPDPCQINLVINELGVDRNKTLIIGDGPADINAGKNANIRTCGVTYGFGTRDEVQNADLVIDDIIELKDNFS